MRWWVLCGLLLLAGMALAAPMAVSVPDAVVLADGVAMVPLPPLAEVLHAELRAGGNTATFTCGGRTFTCTAGRTAATANGVTITLPAAPFARAGVIYAPLRPLVIALGGTLAPIIENDVAITVGAERYALPFVRLGFPPADFRDDDTELYAVNVDGGGLRRLTYDSDDNSLPVFSSDGTQLAYTIGDYILAMRASADARYDDGWTLDVGGHPIDQLYQFAPNGREILCSYSSELDNGGPYLCLLNTTTHAKYILGEALSACFLPGHNSRVLYDTSWSNNKDEVMLLAPADGIPVRIAAGMIPRVTPDGHWLFVEQLDLARGCDLYRIELGPDGPIAPPQLVQHNLENFEINPDGQSLLYTRSEEGDAPWRTALYRYDIATGTERALVTHDAIGSYHISPDGRQIAYFADLASLYLINADGTGQRTLLPRDTADFSLNDFTFTPDGRHILFTDNPQHNLYKPAVW